MEKLNKFEERLRYGACKKTCEKNHIIIENKYIEIFGKEDYERRREETQKSLYSHYKILNSNPQIVKSGKNKTIEQFESEPDYLHILPYIKTQLIYYFKKQGLEIQDIKHFLQLCQN